MVNSQFSVAWDAFEKNICHGLSSLQQRGEFVDMTLAADGHLVRVHRMVLSLVSPYIKELIASADCPHPVIFLNNISYSTLSAMLEYIYTGEVLVNRDNLDELVQAGKALHIKGLTDMIVNNVVTETDYHESTSESIDISKKDSVNKKRQYKEQKQVNTIKKFKIDETNEDVPQPAEEEIYYDNEMVQAGDNFENTYEDEEHIDYEKLDSSNQSESETSDEKVDTLTTLVTTNEFSSLHEMENYIDWYQRHNFVQLWKRDARTIETMRKVCPNKLRGCNADLKYHSVTYSCSRGGRRFESRSRGMRNSHTWKEDCPMNIKLKLSPDGQKLVITSMQENHNHEIETYVC